MRNVKLSEEEIEIIEKHRKNQDQFILEKDAYDKSYLLWEDGVIKVIKESTSSCMGNKREIVVEFKKGTLAEIITFLEKFAD